MIHKLNLLTHTEEFLVFIFEIPSMLILPPTILHLLSTFNHIDNPDSHRHRLSLLSLYCNTVKHKSQGLLKKSKIKEEDQNHALCTLKIIY